MNGDYYDIDGKPMSSEDWLSKFKDWGYKQVARTELGVEHDRVFVSTVWLGTDHGWGSSTPMIFETMIFGLKDDAPCYRYSTKEKALEGHEACVAAVKRGQNFDDFDPLR